jgi:hypothetical protein
MKEAAMLLPLCRPTRITRFCAGKKMRQKQRWVYEGKELAETKIGLQMEK